MNSPADDGGHHGDAVAARHAIRAAAGPAGCRRRITNAGKTSRYENRKTTPESRNTIQNTLEAWRTSSGVADQQRRADHAHDDEGHVRASEARVQAAQDAGSAPSAAAAAATRFTPRLQVTMLATQA